MMQRRMTKRRSKLSEAGDAARRAAMRSLLIEALTACDWNLSDTATRLGMSSASDVLRAINDLEITALLDLARAAGKVSRQTRTPR